MAFKVMGIQRSGTNYLNHLVYNNLIRSSKRSAVLRDPGWKHGFVPRLDNIDMDLRERADNKIIIIIKNPYTWYSSILRWFKKAPR